MKSAEDHKPVVESPARFLQGSLVNAFMAGSTERDEEPEGSSPPGRIDTGLPEPCEPGTGDNATCIIQRALSRVLICWDEEKERQE